MKCLPGRLKIRIGTMRLAWTKTRPGLTKVLPRRAYLLYHIATGLSIDMRVFFHSLPTRMTEAHSVSFKRGEKPHRWLHFIQPCGRALMSLCTLLGLGGGFTAPSRRAADLRASPCRHTSGLSTARLAPLMRRRYLGKALRSQGFAPSRPPRGSALKGKVGLPLPLPWCASLPRLAAVLRQCFLPL